MKQKSEYTQKKRIHLTQNEKWNAFCSKKGTETWNKPAQFFSPSAIPYLPDECYKRNKDSRFMFVYFHYHLGHLESKICANSFISTRYTPSTYVFVCVLAVASNEGKNSSRFLIYQINRATSGNFIHQKNTAPRWCAFRSTNFGFWPLTISSQVAIFVSCMCSDQLCLHIHTAETNWILFSV